ncbi:CsoS2 family carboxysome shell protein [Thiohalocapsa halophila]|nr:CsoS2 family carboxysome shell protein [Thiohalocapsa halophila]
MSLTAFSVFVHLAGAAGAPEPDSGSDSEPDSEQEQEQAQQYPVLPAPARRKRSPALARMPAEQPTPPTATGTGTSYMASKANLKSSGREAALARRKAMSTQGKQGVRNSAPERTRGAARRASAPGEPAPAAAPKVPAKAPQPSRNPSAGSSAPKTPSPRAGTVPQSFPQSPSAKSRELARQRRAALAQQGRRAQRSNDRVRTAEDEAKGSAAAPAATSDKQEGCGCNGERKEAAERPSTDLSQFAHQPGAPSKLSGFGNGKHAALRNKRTEAALGAKPPARMQALARRAALSSRGKNAAVGAQSTASLARQANPKLTARELAQKVRAQRSANGGAGERKSPPVGRIHPNKRKAQQGASQGATDQPWKVAVTETGLGQFVTGTKVGRSWRTTGDEPSTCRNVTGTEYMGADIFREFCQTDPAGHVPKVHESPTGHGQRVTGNEVGRSPRVTGDEPGTCKNVTGTEYLSPTQYEAFCDTRPAPGPVKLGTDKTYGGEPVSGNKVGRSAKVTGDELGAEIKPTGTQYTAPSDIGTDIAPPKVSQSTTLSGGNVTGTRVSRSSKVTGDEPGSCRVVTGDQYVDLSQYQACAVEAQPEPPKVGRSATNKGKFVSGTQTGRSGRVTGDEPGTCKAITGTPYAGLEQAADYCEPPQQKEIQQRTRPLAMTPGPAMTGIQPGISSAKAGGRSFGGGMTGAGKGACEPLTGTPYVGKDQWAEACGGNGAQPDAPDFPQSIDGGGPAQQPAWQGFSVASPAQEAATAKARQGGVTGTSYESNQHITGPFGMATGKITGTEQARFDAKRPRPDLTTPEPTPTGNPGGAAESAESEATAAPAPRITGEGQSAGLKITGDDWDRGERITGTEGTSARRRNPTRPGPMSAMPATERKRNEEAAVPTSRVTGAAGSTDRGALITYSGGARG